MTDSPQLPPRPGSIPTILVRRISFVEGIPAGAIVRRQFAHPRRMAAIEVTSELTHFPEPDSRESAGLFEVVILPAELEGHFAQESLNWMADSPQLVPGSSISVRCKTGQTIEWRPGRAILRSPAENSDEFLTALIGFAFFEGELRALEKIVESQEDKAPQDRKRAHRISRSDRTQWSRIGETIERLTLARLTLARLKPMFTPSSKTDSPVARRLLRQLSVREEVPARLEALSERLEALEDLYEGANDRIADFRGWYHGQVLELIIIVLLLLEIFLMAGDIYLHYLE